MAKEETPKPKRGRRSESEANEQFDLLLKDETSKGYGNPKKNS